MTKQKKNNSPKILNNQWLSKINWFNALTLGIGLVALFFSWRANEITSYQYKSNVVVLSEDRITQQLSGNIPPNGSLADATDVSLNCVHQIRLANLGGAKDSIVNLNVNVLYQGTMSSFYGFNEAIISYDRQIPSELNPAKITYEITDELHNAIDWLYVLIADEHSVTGELPVWANAKITDFPLGIDSFDTLDTEIAISYKVSSGNKFNLDNEIGQVTLADQSLELPSVNFELLFELSSGNIVKSPLVECGTISIEQ